MTQDHPLPIHQFSPLVLSTHEKTNKSSATKPFRRLTILAPQPTTQCYTWFFKLVDSHRTVDDMEPAISTMLDIYTKLSWEEGLAEINAFYSSPLNGTLTKVSNVILRARNRF